MERTEVNVYFMGQGSHCTGDVYSQHLGGSWDCTTRLVVRCERFCNLRSTCTDPRLDHSEQKHVISSAVWALAVVAFGMVSAILYLLKATRDAKHTGQVQAEHDSLVTGQKKIEQAHEVHDEV